MTSRRATPPLAIGHSPWARAAVFLDRHGLALLLILGAAALRLAPLPANVAPIGALALFAGAYLRHPAFHLVPIGALLLSDWQLGFYHAGTMAAVYLGFALSAAIGRGLLFERDRVGRIAAATGAGALAFWLISNFGVWLFFRDHSWAGFAQCYVDALPFLGRSLVGDALWVVALFGGYRLARRALARCWPAAAA